MLIVWTLGVVVGLTLAVAASRRALAEAADLGAAVGLSPFAIGMTIVAVGTDLPEVANSIVACASGHGDLNVGDSIGSVVTQSTVVLGIVCLLGVITAPRPTVITAGSLTVLALLVGAVLISDQEFGRIDGALMVAVWVVGTMVMQRPEHRKTATEASPRSIRHAIGRTIIWLGVVGAGSALAITAFSRAASDLGAPEFLLSFFVLSLGTSLPELVIAARAVRNGSNDLALGDLLGSSFVDATLSPGIGPLLFPTVVSSGVARGMFVVAAVLAVVTALLARDTTHRWATGIALLCLYAVLFPALIT